MGSEGEPQAYDVREEQKQGSKPRVRLDSLSEKQVIHSWDL